MQGRNVSRIESAVVAAVDRVELLGAEAVLARVTAVRASAIDRTAQPSDLERYLFLEGARQIAGIKRSVRIKGVRLE